MRKEQFEAIVYVMDDDTNCATFDRDMPSRGARWDEWRPYALVKWTGRLMRRDDGEHDLAVAGHVYTASQVLAGDASQDGVDVLIL